MNHDAKMLAIEIQGDFHWSALKDIFKIKDHFKRSTLVHQIMKYLPDNKQSKFLNMLDKYAEIHGIKEPY